MKTLLTTSIGVDEGEDIVFSDFEDDGEMWTGAGPRERRQHVRFKRDFHHNPTVFVSLAMWDFDTATNARADVGAENITKSGFDVVFKTWGDTRVARVRVRWMAIGSLPSEDDWELY